MAEKKLEIVIDTPARLWMQRHWYAVAAAAAALAGVAGWLIPICAP